MLFTKYVEQNPAQVDNLPSAAIETHFDTAGDNILHQQYPVPFTLYSISSETAPTEPVVGDTIPIPLTVYPAQDTVGYQSIYPDLPPPVQNESALNGKYGAYSSVGPLTRAAKPVPTKNITPNSPNETIRPIGFGKNGE